MKTLRIALVAALTLSLGGTAFAGDLRESAARAAADQTAPTPQLSGGARVATVSGAALFAVGMTVGLYAFINNQNGEYSEFGEAAATNKPLGAAGISLAFAGGMMMFFGTHTARKLPSVTVGKGTVAVGKQLTW